MRRLGLLLASVVALPALAGCVADPPSSGRLAEATRPGFEPNLLLLKAPRPAGALVSYGAEPSILADLHGSWIWIGDTTGVFRSGDNGTTWSPRYDPWLTPLFDGVTLAQSSEGVLYVSSTSGANIVFGRSLDGATTWDRVASYLVDAAPIADRPWIAARGESEVALVFYDFGRTFSETCARSTDGGLAFADRKPLFGSPQGGNLVFDAAGALYYVSSGGIATRSVGGCLGVQRTVDMFPGPDGAQTMLQVATDGVNLYAASPSSGNGAIRLAGLSGWSVLKTITVSPPALKSNTYATVSASGDEIAVAWYGSETPGNPANAAFSGSWNVFVARVRGFWTATPSVELFRLTTAPNHVGDICMGGISCGGESDRDLLDYFMVDHDRWGGIHVAYGDDTGSRRTVRHAHVPP